MTADDVKTLLGLEPHPREGGYFVQTYAARETVSLERYGGPRKMGTAIYYLLEPNNFSGSAIYGNIAVTLATGLFEPPASASRT